MFLIIDHDVLTRTRVILMLVMVKLSLAHVRVRVIHNYASLKGDVYFSWILVFDLVVLISNNIIRMLLVILNEVEVGQKLGFY